jgi:hypothetical protein
VKQQEKAPPAPPGPGLDLIRLSQFLELSGELLLGGRDGEAVARRIVEGAAVVLRVPGVAVGVLEEDVYAVRAAYCPGADAEWPRVAPAVARGTVTARRPVVVPAGQRRIVLLPFRGPAAAGALEVMLPEEGGLSEDDVALARVLALFAGLALSNVPKHGRPGEPMDEFALADVLGELAAGAFARPTSEGRLRWRQPSDVPLLRTDRPKLREIVVLLLQDALAHEEAREVEVDIAATTRDSLRITVRDAAGGLAPEALPPRVRALAEALGGRVAARSTLSEGTAVTVEIPFVAPPPGGR